MSAYDNKPVEFWPTAAIRLAVQSGDLTIWQRIVLALRRDPYGRTARQIEEVVETTTSPGITKALTEVLARSRTQLEADERAEVA
ncbi:MAG TPA: XRE family transcriptional regulator, partial [Mycobacterium sp.]|nr:XRE family transcriptional regulator [Mycobacterium sp.]